ncbi:hypothetical protein [Nocardioides sp.]|uniref:hypothetical protein n=1 Tax=Nocardioides sp. TaxID=35761 RepID=UPI003D0E1DFF
MTDQDEPGGAAPDRGPHNPRPGAEVTALAAQLRRVSDRVEQLHGLHGDLAVSVSEQLGPDLAQLRGQVAAMDQQLQDVLEVLERERRTAPVHWPSLTVDQAQREWALLAEWVEEILVPWYGIIRGDLPDCWALHRTAVVELSWWRGTYVQAYQARSPATLAAEWHDRWRRIALANIRAAISDRLCAPGRHQTSEDELRAARPTAPREPGSSGSYRQQLAERRHWNAFYEQAVAADLQWRRDRQ